MSQYPQNGSINPTNSIMKRLGPGSSLAGQWLTHWAPNAGGPGSVLGQGTISHMLQLRVHMLQPTRFHVPQLRSKIDLGQNFVYLLVSNHCNPSKNCWVSKSQITSGPKNSQNVKIFPWKVPLEGDYWNDDRIHSSSRGPCFHLNQ